MKLAQHAGRRSSCAMISYGVSANSFWLLSIPKESFIPSLLSRRPSVRQELKSSVGACQSRKGRAHRNGLACPVVTSHAPLILLILSKRGLILRRSLSAPCLFPGGSCRFCGRGPKRSTLIHPKTAEIRSMTEPAYLLSPKKSR